MIILFDVDGVLVENRAYRASIQRTTEYFAQRLGLAIPTPTEAEIEAFEAESITVEWDTCGIIIAALFLERLRHDAAHAGRRAAPPALPGDVWAALDELPALKTPPDLLLDFASLARRVGTETRVGGGLPAEAALRLYLADLDVEGHPFASIARPLLGHLLADMYAIERSPAMQVFQNYVLGDQAYAAYYGLPVRVMGEGLLQQLDRPLLNGPWPAEILRRRAVGALFPVLFTARPSLAPVENAAPVRGYTPEAEIARDLVGLEGVPAMGFGKVDWMARRVGRAGSDLVKPSPVHAMAALGAARTGLEVESLKAALAVERGDHLRYPLTACASQEVHVFEDSTSSLAAVARAVALVNRQGLNLRLVRHGIAPGGSPKREALAAQADAMHVDVCAGLESIF
jgi:hypothetical protein